MAGPSFIALVAGSAFRMPRTLICVWLMTWCELGLARAALLYAALRKGRRGQNHGSRYDHWFKHSVLSSCIMRGENVPISWVFRIFPVLRRKGWRY